MKRMYSFIKKTLAFILLFNGVLLFGQTHGPNRVDENRDYTMEQTATDSLLFWKEQIVLHTNKTSVLPKDFLFFKAFVLLGPQQFRSSVSQVLKLELLDGKGNLIKSQHHKIIDGTSEGSIEIPKKTEYGDYYLRAYTRWMLNYGPEHFALKKIKIGVPTDLVKSKGENAGDINFFPEGGQLISGMTNRVLVTTGFANASDLPIVDAENREVASVKNYGNGIGSFLFKPSGKQQYSLLISDNVKIPLPEVQDVGYTIQASNLKNEELLLRIETSKELENQTMFLKGNANGINFFEKKVQFKNGTVTEMHISKDKMPKGIINLQLEDEFGAIWATRPFYIDATELEVELTPVSLKQKKGTFSVKVTDSQGNPVQTEISLALTGENAYQHPRKSSSGLVPVDMSIRNQRYLNDLLLLTGQYSEMGAEKLESELPSEVRYRFQDGLDFYGQAFDLNKSLLPNTKIQAMILDEDEVVVEEVETNSEGFFKLEGIFFEGEVDMVFRTTGEEPKNKLVQVIPYEYEIPPLKIEKEENIEKSSLAKRSQQSTLLKNTVDLEAINKADDKLVALDGVTLTQKKGFKKVTPSIYNLEPSRVVYQDVEKPRTIPQLFLGITGFQVAGLGDLNPEISLLQSSGVGPVLWILDGLPLSQPTSLVQIINIVNYTDIERIEILTGPQASIYGSRAAGGAIIIYTRNGADKNYIARKEAQLSYMGYHESKDFDDYKESIPRKLKNKSGIPLALYWNPVLKTDENGEATFQFSKPENIETIYFDVKVISVKGKRGSAELIWSL